MRTIAAALLLSGSLACSQPEGAELKVLGFTLGKPPPEGAVLQADGGRHKWYTLEHHWCFMGASALTDNNLVASVDCAADYDTMLSLLKSRYGQPVKVEGCGELDDDDVWLTPAGLGIAVDRLGIVWAPAKTEAELLAAIEARDDAIRKIVDASLEAIDGVDWRGELLGRPSRRKAAQDDAEIGERENAADEDF